MKLLVRLLLSIATVATVLPVAVVLNNTTAYALTYDAQVAAYGANHYWKMNDSSSPLTDTGASTHLNMTLNGTYTTGVASLVPSASDPAVQFSTGYATATSTVTTDGSGIAVAMWIKTTSGNQVLFQMNSNTTSPFSATFTDSIFIDTSGHVNANYWDGISGTTLGNTSVNVTDGNVHFIVASGFICGASHIYVDNIDSGAGGSNCPVSETLYPHIGGGYNNSQFNGTIDDVAWWIGTTLNATQVATLYGAGSPTPAFQATGNVCTVANLPSNNNYPACTNSQAPYYLVGSLVQFKDNSGNVLGSGFTNSSGAYNFTVYSVTPGATYNLSLAVYGPNANLNYGWFPIGGSYLVTLPPTGPYQNLALDFEYVIPEAVNSEWWTVTTGSLTNQRVPCLNITNQSCSIPGSGGGGAFGSVAVALIVPSFGAVITPGGTDKPQLPGGVVTNTFNVDVTNPGSSTATIIVSNDQNPPVVGNANTTTVNIPAATTQAIPVVGTGGIQGQTGTTVITGTMQGTTTIPVTIVPAPISTTGQATGTVVTNINPPNPTNTVVGQTTCNLNLFSLWSDFGPLMECLFIPTQPISALFEVTDTTGTKTQLDQAVKQKEGFAELFTVVNWICPGSPCNISGGIFGNMQSSTPCWAGFIPWFVMATGLLDNTKTTWNICANDAIPTILRNGNTVCILLFALNGLIDLSLKLFTDMSRLSAAEVSI